MSKGRLNQCYFHTKEHKAAIKKECVTLYVLKQKDLLYIK